MNVSKTRLSIFKILPSSLREVLHYAKKAWSCTSGRSSAIMGDYAKHPTDHPDDGILTVEKLPACDALTIERRDGIVPTTLPGNWVSQGCYVYARTTLH
jgi:hypothetical protein